MHFLKWTHNTLLLATGSINDSFRKSRMDQNAGRHVSSSSNPLRSRREKELLLSFPWGPVRLVCIVEKNLFGVQLASQITISFFLSGNEKSLVQRSRHGGLETAEHMCKCTCSWQRHRMRLLDLVKYLEIEAIGWRCFNGHVFTSCPLVSLYHYTSFTVS